jgi:hypothetical protein
MNTTTTLNQWHGHISRSTGLNRAQHRARDETFVELQSSRAHVGELHKGYGLLTAASVVPLPLSLQSAVSKAVKPSAVSKAVSDRLICCQLNPWKCNLVRLEVAMSGSAPLIPYQALALDQADPSQSLV